MQKRKRRGGEGPQLGPGREIQKYQRSAELLLSKAAFEKLVSKSVSRCALSRRAMPRDAARCHAMPRDAAHV